MRISHSWEMPYSEIRANLRKAAVLQLKLQDVLQLLGRSRRGWILAWQWRRLAKETRRESAPGPATVAATMSAGILLFTSLPLERKRWRSRALMSAAPLSHPRW